jgi:hypothetical protein
MNATPLTVDQTESCFKEMLDKAGVDFAAPDVLKIWKIFKEFAHVPVVCADDGCLFE